MRTQLSCSLLLLLTATAHAQYAIKEATTEPPKEVARPILDLLAPGSIQLTDKDGALLAELWLRKELPSPAVPQQVKNGLTYRELEETTLVGVMHLVQEGIDFRKQKIPAGVYTLRLAFQPETGDHQDTAPHTEFCLAVPVAHDKKPDLIKDATALHELSAKSTGSSHPSPWLLVPAKDPGKAPKLESVKGGLQVLTWRQTVRVKDGTTTLPFGLTLVGHSSTR